MEGVDYAWARPGVAELRAAGKRFAGRYVGPGTPGKLLTSSEAGALTRGGVAIVSLAEGASDGALGGYARGVEHARSARAHAWLCGMPARRPIYFAVDFDATPAQLSTVEQYFRGVASVMGPGQVGVYGGYRTIDYCAARGLATWFFQTYAWSQGRWHPRATLHQYRNGVSLAGGIVDLCRSTVDDIGQWTVGDLVSPESEDDMTPEQAKQLTDVHFVLTHCSAPDGTETRNLHNWTGDANRQLSAVQEALRAEIDIDERAIASYLAANERFVGAIVEGLRSAVGMIPTASEVGKAVATELRDRLED
jgi:Rv2525c-like, glycoside hydrolase-like domain